MTAETPPGLDRAALYFRFLIERGGLRRYGTPRWKTPERAARIEHELAVIEDQGFSSTFVMLADVMEFCRHEKIFVGPGRGSVGGSFCCYLAGIHDVDSIQWGLRFARFMNENRVSFPDVDIDVSQRDRPRVLQYIVDTYTRDDQVVMQIGAFVRAGGRAVVDLMATATQHVDSNAWATATNLKKCFPEGSITGGQKIARELHAWLYGEKGHGDKEAFIEQAEQAGWLAPMLKLDGMFTHLGKHAAGVVILRKEDLPFIPTLEVNDSNGKRNTVTAYDMYSLDDLGYLKWDWLGLRTLDVISDAHKFAGGSGERDDLIKLWQENLDHPGPYQLLAQTDTEGVFQMATDGYRRTLKHFEPESFDHLVQLVALYRPGAIDYRRDDGKNMVEVFIDRRHGREPVTFDHPDLAPLLKETYGVILYQEQQMDIVRELGGFTEAQADDLRRAIGKKKAADMARLLPLFKAGMKQRGIADAVVERISENIDAAARYSWNKSHAVEYAVITWWTAWFKDQEPAAFYAAEINSWEDKKDRQANIVAEARQHADFSPPDVNLAEDRFIVEDRSIVFGLNGIKGMGDANRSAILVERMIDGPFASFSDFCQRLPSVPINMKLSLVKCGAFDKLHERAFLLAVIPKTKSDKTWTVAEHINHNTRLKTLRPLPDDITEYVFPTDTQIAQGELETMGYYISNVPMKALIKSLGRHSANVLGGEVEKVLVKADKNSNDMGHITVILPNLTKQLIRIFASNWPQYSSRVVKGAQLLFQGRHDGNAFLADKCWDPDDVRHFKKIKVRHGDEKPVMQDFDGELSTIQALEQAGYRVKLL